MRCTTQIGLMLLCYVVTVQAGIDCKKFVFAPPCRGITAKRSEPFLQIRSEPRHNEADASLESEENGVIPNGGSINRRDRGHDYTTERLMRQLLASYARFWKKNRMLEEDQDY